MATARLTAEVNTKGAARSKQELDRFSNSAKNAESNVIDLNNAVKRGDNGLGGIGRRAGMASIQIQQFVGQVTTGTSAATALSQQSADLGFVLGFPLLGAVTGIAAAIAGPFIASLFGAGVEVDNLQEKLKELAETELLTAEQAAFLAAQEKSSIAERKEKIDTLKDEIKANEDLATAIARGQGGRSVAADREGAIEKINESLIEQRATLSLLNREQQKAEERVISYGLATSEVAAESEELDRAQKSVTKSLNSQLIALRDGEKAAIEYNVAQSLGLESAKDIPPEIQKQIDALSELSKARESATQKAKAEAEVQRLLNLGGTGLESIDREEQQQLARLESLNLQKLGLEQEYIDAKKAIEDSADQARFEFLLSQAEKEKQLKDKKLKEDKERYEEQTELIRSLGDAFTNDVSRGITDVITQQENLKDSAINVAKSITDTVINSLVRQVVQQQITDRFVATSFQAAKASEVATGTAQAAFNAFVSTAGAPFPANLGAPAAAAAAGAQAASLGSAVIGAASTREQGGSLAAGQSSTFAERGELEILTPNSASRVRTAQQMRQIMGESGGNNVNITVIDQSPGEKSFETDTDSNGDTVLLIRQVVSGDIADPDSDIGRTMVGNLNVGYR